MDNDEIELTTEEEAAALLFEKILENSAEEVSILLKGFPGIANEFTDSHGNTALHLAAASGNKEMVKILVEEGYADIFAKNQKGQTPAEAAKENQRTYVETAMGYTNTDQAQEYLAQVASDLKALHKSHIENTTSPWLAELKNQDGKKLSDLVQERKEEDRAIEAKKLQESQDAKAAEGKKIFEEEVAKRERSQTMSFDTTSSFNQEKFHKQKGFEPKLAEVEKQRIDNVKQNILRAITDSKVKKILEEKMDYNSSTDPSIKEINTIRKIDFLVRGIKEGNTKEKDDIIYSTKELAKLVAPKRTSAKLAKLLTFGYRKTDNDLVKEAIDQLKTAIHNPNNNATKVDSIKRWSKNNSKEKQV